MARIVTAATVAALAVLATTATCAAASGLVDHPIAGASLTYIDSVSGGGKWVATSPTAGLPPVPATVPGDLITDLEAAGHIGDPLRELNWLQDSHYWDQNVWTYATNFTMDAAAAMAAKQDGGEVLLVFDGIKMASSIKLNGVALGATTDQFLRYTYPLKASGAPVHTGEGATNMLEVTFDSSVGVNGRFMACTGGWDWAPYTDTYNEGAHTMSKGIWKSVSIVSVPAGAVAITHFSPLTYYNGSDFPVEPLPEHQHGGFRVSAKVHLWASAAVNEATIAVTPAWGSGAKVTKTVSVPAANSSTTLDLFAAAADIELWWPNGVGTGKQSLYNITASVSAGSTTVSATRRIGFRYFALVTGNDTDPAYVKANMGVDGTDTMGMRFRVNGAAIWSRGANMIPTDEMEGRYSALAHRRNVEYAVAAGMNTLRVWGGGVFLPDEWYDACDELGVLVYHDMQFAQQGHSPCDPACSTQDAEFRHQVRRLSHHPAIAIWDGCNECRVVLGSPTGIYATFVLTVVAQEDDSRVVWPSCPAHGWDHGVNRLDAIPNGSPKGLAPATGSVTIETHGPYQHGGGFPAMNGPSDLEPFDPLLPMTVSTALTGLGVNNVFASEFGASVWSSFESVSATLDESHWSLHGGSPPDQCHVDADGVGVTCKGNNTAAQRNYPCDVYLDVYFNMTYKQIDPVGEDAFKQQLYLCMIGQSLKLKSDIEQRRSTNSFGTIVWQYGEIWPTGGWGSIEYGPENRAGQVVGGRWKPLHYLYKASLMTDVTAACGATGSAADEGVAAGGGAASGADDTVGSPRPEDGKCTLQANTDYDHGLITYHPKVGSPGDCCAACAANATCEVGVYDTQGQCWFKPTSIKHHVPSFVQGVTACWPEGHGPIPPAPPTQFACYVKNDRAAAPFSGTVVVSAVALATGEVTQVAKQSVTLGAGPGVSQDFYVNLSQPMLTTHVYVTETFEGSATAASEGAEEGAAQPMSHNVQLFATPYTLQLAKATVTFAVAGAANPDGSVDITVTTSGGAALYVTLTTLEQGYFSDNAFLGTPTAAKVVQFIPVDNAGVDIAKLKASLRVEHLATYMA